MFNSLDIAAKVRCDGATKTAQNLKASLEAGEISYKELGKSVKLLFECLVVDKADDKTPAGPRILAEQMLAEDAASFVNADSFGLLTSQIYLNATMTTYNSADYSVKDLFRKIPSVLTKGEYFGGLSNIAEALKPVGMSAELPTLTPSEDYSLAPAQERRGAIMNIGLDMVGADASGQIMNYFERFGECIGLTDELEACSTLSDVDHNSTSGATYARTHHNWLKQGPLPTYSSSAVSASNPWQNLLTGGTANPLTDWNSVNNAFVQLATTVDPFTSYPIVVHGKYVIVVPTGLAMTAARIKHSTQFRTGTASSSNSIIITSGDGASNVVDFEIVVSKYLYQILTNNGVATTQWYFSVPGQAFSWQSKIEMATAQAQPNSGHMFSRSLAASYKCERVKTSYVFNPRYTIKNLAS